MAKKRARESSQDDLVVQNKRRRGLRGRLEGVINLPMELFIMVLSHLAPYDLLRLSRTDKRIRSILMHPSSASLWKRSRDNVDGLPDLPFDLPEPAYANLVFYPYCHFCSSTKQVKKVYWRCRMRCCSSCVPDLFVYCYFDKYPFIEEYKMWYSVPKEDRAGIYKPVADKLLTEFNACKGDPVKIADWIAVKSKEHALVRTHADDCAKWQKQKRDEQNQASRDAKRSRYEWLVKQVTTEGLGNEITKLPRKDASWLFKTFVPHTALRGKQGSELTKNEWDQIKTPVIEFLENNRATRWNAEKERRHRLLGGSYLLYRHTHRNLALPSLEEVTVSGPFKNIIEGVALDQPFSVAAFGPAFANQGYFSRWRHDRQQQVLQKFNRTITACTALNVFALSSVTGDWIPLVTAIFECRQCKKLLCYADVLNHTCYTGLRDAGAGEIDFHLAASAAALRILCGAGLDPRELKWEELARMRLNFECRQCPGVFMNDYLETIRHAIQNQHSHAVVKGALYDPTPVFRTSDLVWTCSHCHGSFSTTAIFSHLVFDHGLQNVGEQDYVQDYAGEQDWYVEPADVAVLTGM